MATQKGEIKRVPLERFANIRSSGIIAMDLEEGDHLISARWAASEEDEIMVVTRNGMSVCFPVAQLRVRSRTAGGVRAIRLRDDDYLISMEVVDPQGNLLAVSENGFGKLTRMDRFRRQGRGGSGVIAFKVNDKTGPSPRRSSSRAPRSSSSPPPRHRCSASPSARWACRAV